MTNRVEINKSLIVNTPNGGNSLTESIVAYFRIALNKDVKSQQLREIIVNHINSNKSIYEKKIPPGFPSIDDRMKIMSQDNVYMEELELEAVQDYFQERKGNNYIIRVYVLDSNDFYYRHNKEKINEHGIDTIDLIKHGNEYKLVLDQSRFLKKPTQSSQIVSNQPVMNVNQQSLTGIDLVNHYKTTVEPAIVARLKSQNDEINSLKSEVHQLKTTSKIKIKSRIKIKFRIRIKLDKDFLITAIQVQLL
jgi:hypothetical protein